MVFWRDTTGRKDEKILGNKHEIRLISFFRAFLFFVSHDG